MVHPEYAVLLKEVRLIHEKAVRNQIISSNYQWMAGGLPRKGPLTLNDSKSEKELPNFAIPIKKKNFKNICNNFILRKLQMLIES